MVLETQRLRLRPITWGDAADIYAYAREPKVAHFMSWQASQSISESYDFIMRTIQRQQSGEEITFALEVKTSQKVIGCLSVRWQSKHHARIGYVIGSPHWGQGYTTEAVVRVNEWIFEHEDIIRIDALCDVENIGSRRVMEKAGMQREGLLRNYAVIPALAPSNRDMYLYTLLPAELE